MVFLDPKLTETLYHVLFPTVVVVNLGLGIFHSREAFELSKSVFGSCLKLPTRGIPEKNWSTSIEARVWQRIETNTPLLAHFRTKSYLGDPI